VFCASTETQSSNMRELFEAADGMLHEVTSQMRSITGLTDEKVAAIADLMAANAIDEEINKVLSKK
jgi:hypothetical protein